MAGERGSQNGAKINPNLIYVAKFGNRKTGKTDSVPMLTLDGYIDYAHQLGLISLTTEIVKIWDERTPAGLDENNQPKESVTRWCIVKAIAVIKGGIKGDNITVTGITCVNDLDKFVKNPGGEIAVAETRAKKRALAGACGITDDMIAIAVEEKKKAPIGQTRFPKRETVDAPLETDYGDDGEGIPSDVKTTPNITPPLTSTPIREGEGFEF